MVGAGLVAALVAGHLGENGLEDAAAESLQDAAGMFAALERAEVAKMAAALWEASGLAYPELLDELIRLALDRHRKKAGLSSSYQPKSDWYR